MSSRIKKILGYGLIDIKANKKLEITDNRFNKEGYFLKYEEDHEWTMPLFLKWLQEKKVEEKSEEYYQLKQTIWDVSQNINKQFSDLIYYDSEFGLKRVMCIVPIGHNDWVRYDDTIDYYQNGNKVANSVKLLDGGIYPYNASYVDIRDGRRVDSLYFHNLKSMLKLNMVNDHNLGLCGLNNINEMRFVHAKVPHSITAMCEYLQIFNLQQTALKLKPMIYTYFS
jgi:hypothetical protein